GRVIKKSKQNFAWIQHFKRDKHDSNNVTLLECMGCELNFKKTKVDGVNCIFKIPSLQARVLTIKKKQRDHNQNWIITTRIPICKRSKTYIYSLDTIESRERIMDRLITIASRCV